MTVGSGHRLAATLGELQSKTACMVSTEGYRAGLEFVPRLSDVIIAPYAKCGTTWLQQMVHSLRTGGDLDFDDISRVVPWIETAGDLGIDASQERFAIACDQSSFESMRLNQDKFDDALMRAYCEQACDLPQGSKSNKVRTGGVGGHRIELSEALLNDLELTWRDTIGAEFGLPDYGALLEELAAS